jgi:signal transduction histidine kinase/FixJ family two-component response regulator
VIKALRRLFLDTEFEVLTAGNALDALALLRVAGAVAAVVSDYRMPGMNGVELLAEVFRNWPETSRIILSGYADTATVLEAINLGHVDKFIPKPWDDAELIGTVRGEVNRFAVKVDDQHETRNIRQKAKDLTVSNVKLQKVVEAKNVALKASEARLKEAQKIARMGDWEWIAATGEMSWSDEMYCLHGVLPSQYSPSLQAYQGLLLPEDREQVFVTLHEQLKGNDRFTFSHRIRLPNGDVRQMVVRGQPWRTPDGDVIGLLATTMDDTERVLMTEELRRLNDELETRVRLRTKELEEKVAELDAFTAAVSHDLRAPMRHLCSYSQMLMENLGDRLVGQDAEMLLKIAHKSAAATEMVDALLELSRLGKREVLREEVNLSGMTTDILHELAAAEPERQHRFAIAPELKVDADFQLIGVVLCNLLGNAWKYSGNCTQTVISFSARVGDNGGTVFCIKDNGAGFDMQYAGKLFTPFQRLHRQEEFAGTGIGLATVCRIVRLHGGRIWAESAPGDGARFYFTLGEQKGDTDVTSMG